LASTLAAFAAKRPTRNAGIAGKASRIRFIGRDERGILLGAADVEEVANALIAAHANPSVLAVLNAPAKAFATTYS
jgi:hypothetical protein